MLLDANHASSIGNIVVSYGMEMQGMASQCKDIKCMARLGRIYMESKGKDRNGKERSRHRSRYEKERKGRSWQGNARKRKARQAKEIQCKERKFKERKC